VGSFLRLRNLKQPIRAWKNLVSELKMVLCAHKERRFLLETQPYLTNWIPIAVPIDRWLIWPPPMNHPLFAFLPVLLPFVMKFYDSLSKFSCPHSYVMSKRQAKVMFPMLRDDIKYVQVFYEGQHNDSRTAISIALSAASEGATVANYVQMEAILRADGSADGQAVGVRCRDQLTGQEFNVKAKAIIFAGGPFTDSMRKIEDPSSKPAVMAAAGTHLVLPGYYSPVNMGLLDINTSM
jgi:glycerol-3-phosphate dehydrogenase